MLKYCHISFEIFLIKINMNILFEAWKNQKAKPKQNPLYSWTIT